jgi:PAS domain S-box-containing protein
MIEITGHGNVQPLVVLIWLNIILGIVTAVFALSHHLGKKNNGAVFLFVAIAFLVTAVLDTLFHLLPFFWTVAPGSLLVRDWWPGSLFLTAVFALGLYRAARRLNDDIPAEIDSLRIVTTVGGVFVLSLLIPVVCNVLHIDSVYMLAVVELIPAGLIALCVILCLPGEKDKITKFELWFGIALGMIFIAQAAFIFSSYDASYPTVVAGYVFKILAAVFVMTGLLLRNHQLLSLAERSLQSLTWATEEVQQEIEERRWAEERLHESRMYAERIVETIREPLLVLDADLRIIRANRSFFDIFKVKPKKIMDHFFHEICEAQWNIADLLEKLKTILPEDTFFEDYEVTQFFGAIGVRTMLLNARRIYRGDIDNNLILLAMEDITARKKAEEEARRLVRGIESAAESIFMTNSDGEIQYVNPAFTKLTGYASDEAIGKTPAILKSRKQSPEYYKRMWTTILAGDVWTGEICNVKKDGTLHHVNLTIAPVFDNDNNIEGFVASQNDISELKTAKEELAWRADALARSNNELQQFAYIASHDLQEPLRMVSSYCQLLQRRYQEQLDEDAHEFINYAVDGAKRMQILINDLLSYSRVGTKGLPFKPTDCNLVLEHAIDNLKVAIQESHVDIKVGSMPVVLADEIQLVQLFQNLIGNAIKFRQNGSTEIEVDSKRKNGQWLISVRDNGIGIDEQFAERIFVIFQRLHNNRDYPGTGMGLAICKKIVERHGGNIWVKSKPEKGSVFYFTLPRKKVE